MRLRGSGDGLVDHLLVGRWVQELAALAMPPARFERLAQRLLREAGFISATVMGRSGNGGIDVLGV
jgi:restriction system protein